MTLQEELEIAYLAYQQTPLAMELFAKFIEEVEDKGKDKELLITKR